MYPMQSYSPAGIGAYLPQYGGGSYGPPQGPMYMANGGMVQAQMPMTRQSIMANPNAGALNLGQMLMPSVRPNFNLAPPPPAQMPAPAPVQPGLPGLAAGASGPAALAAAQQAAMARAQSRVTASGFGQYRDTTPRAPSSTASSSGWSGWRSGSGIGGTIGNPFGEMKGVTFAPEMYSKSHPGWIATTGLSSNGWQTQYNPATGETRRILAG